MHNLVGQQRGSQVLHISLPPTTPTQVEDFILVMLLVAIGNVYVCLKSTLEIKQKVNPVHACSGALFGSVYVCVYVCVCVCVLRGKELSVFIQSGSAGTVLCITHIVVDTEETSRDKTTAAPIKISVNIVHLLFGIW